MPALLEEPQPRTKRPAPRTAWNKEQAASARLKSLEVRRNNAVKRKATAQQAATILKSICEAEPITDVERALSLAAKHGKAKAVESLASALAKLKRAGVGRPEPSAFYTPTNGIAPRQPTPVAPQVTQAHAPQGYASEANFAQCREPLVEQAKESLSCGTVGCHGPGEAPRGQAAGGVSEHITRTAYSSPEQEIAALEARLAVLRQQVKQVPVVSQVQSVGVAPVEPVEKFCVNGVWIAGVRKK